MAERKETSRRQILWHICQFSLGIEIAGQPYAGLSDMRFRHNKLPAIGSLVAMQSMHDTNWYLAWVLGVTGGRNDFETKYTLESIETGEVVDWSNVSILEYDRTQSRDHPEWRWTDAQWGFQKRWNAVCYKEKDAYIVLPVQAEFDEEGSGVTLGTRTQFGFDNCRPTKHFDDWRKVTKKMMGEWFDEAVALRDAQPKPQPPVQDSQTT